MLCCMLAGCGVWDILLERAGLNTAASVAGGDDARGLVRDLLAVAAHGCVAAVEDRRLLGILSPSSPVPVLWALVSV